MAEMPSRSNAARCMRPAAGNTDDMSGNEVPVTGSDSTIRPSRAASAAWAANPRSSLRASLPQNATSRPPCSATWRQASIHCAASTSARYPGTAPGIGATSMFRPSSFMCPSHRFSPDQHSGLPIPRRQVWRNENPQHEYQREMQEHRDQRRRMRQSRHFRLAKYHRLHFAEDRGESHAERYQQDRRRPRLLAHRGSKDNELAREHTERRDAEDGDRAQHQAPADGRIGL